MKVGTLYLCTGHVVPSTLIILEKDECSEIVAAVEKGEQIVVVDSNTTLWHNRLGHVSEKGIKYFIQRKFYQVWNVLIWIFVKFACMENKREWVL